MTLSEEKTKGKNFIHPMLYKKISLRPRQNFSAILNTPIDQTSYYESFINAIYYSIYDERSNLEYEINQDFEKFSLSDINFCNSIDPEANSQNKLIKLKDIIVPQKTEVNTNDLDHRLSYIYSVFSKNHEIENDTPSNNQKPRKRSSLDLSNLSNGIVYNSNYNKYINSLDHWYLKKDGKFIVKTSLLQQSKNEIMINSKKLVEMSGNIDFELKNILEYSFKLESYINNNYPNLNNQICLLAERVNDWRKINKQIKTKFIISYSKIILKGYKKRNAVNIKKSLYLIKNLKEMQDFIKILVTDPKKYKTTFELMIKSKDLIEKIKKLKINLSNIFEDNYEKYSDKVFGQMNKEFNDVILENFLNKAWISININDEKNNSKNFFISDLSFREIKNGSIGGRRVINHIKLGSVNMDKINELINGYIKNGVINSLYMKLRKSFNEIYAIVIKNYVDRINSEIDKKEETKIVEENYEENKKEGENTNVNTEDNSKMSEPKDKDTNEFNKEEGEISNNKIQEVKEEVPIEGIKTEDQENTERKEENKEDEDEEKSNKDPQNNDQSEQVKNNEPSQEQVNEDETEINININTKINNEQCLLTLISYGSNNILSQLKQISNSIISTLKQSSDLEDKKNDVLKRNFESEFEEIHKILQEKSDKIVSSQILKCIKELIDMQLQINIDNFIRNYYIIKDIINSNQETKTKFDNLFAECETDYIKLWYNFYLSKFKSNIYLTWEELKNISNTYQNMVNTIINDQSLISDSDDIQDMSIDSVNDQINKFNNLLFDKKDTQINFISLSEGNEYKVNQCSLDIIQITYEIYKLFCLFTYDLKKNDSNNLNLKRYNNLLIALKNLYMNHISFQNDEIILGKYNIISQSEISMTYSIIKLLLTLKNKLFSSKIFLSLKKYITSNILDDFNSEVNNRCNLILNQCKNKIQNLVDIYCIETTIKELNKNKLPNYNIITGDVPVNSYALTLIKNMKKIYECMLNSFDNEFIIKIMNNTLKKFFDNLEGFIFNGAKIEEENRLKQFRRDMIFLKKNFNFLTIIDVNEYKGRIDNINKMVLPESLLKSKK